MLGIFKIFFRKNIKEFENKIASLEMEIKNKDAIFSEKEILVSKLRSSLNEKDEKITVLHQESEKKDSIIQESQEDILKLEQEIKTAMKEIEEKDKDLDSKKEKLEFIAQVINSNPVKNASYEKYLRLLHEDYMKYANENDSLAGEAAALLKLQNVSKQLELLTYDDALLNKTIVAIAGSFSSGKSSFMNSFFTTRKIKLPTGMDQTTAISSYVMNGDESITGYSYRGGRINIANNVFKLFSYGKVEEFNFNMKQIINHIVFRNQFVKEFSNLCFIDTPGFNPGQETETDYDTATIAIATASSIIWCIDGSAGTIKGDEFDILYDIFSKNKDIGIYIVLNKADLKSYEENLSILDEIENQLNIKCIPFEGITLYTSQRSFINQPEEYNCYRGISLMEFLDNNNTENKQKEETLLKLVDDVFEEYINADKQRIAKLEKQIRTLKILENSFSSINDSKDEQISYYKARVDTKRFQMKQFDESSQKDEDLFDSLADLKNELKQTVENDKSDIEKANELCTSMKKAVAEVFGHKLSATKKQTEESSCKDSNTQKSDVKYCNNCGTKNKQDARFCINCGKDFL